MSDHQVHNQPRLIDTLLLVAKWLLLFAGAVLFFALIVRLALFLAALVVPEVTEAMVLETAVPEATLETTVGATPTPTASPTPLPPTPTPLPPTPTPLPPSPRLLAGDLGVNVRSGPSTQFERVGFLEPGAEAPIVGQAQGWWLIEHGGQRAWVSGEVVRAFDVAAAPVVEAPPLPTPEPAPLEPTPTPLPGWAEQEGRWIDVDLSEQRLTAYEGAQLVKSYLVSTGLPVTPTPVGQFRIWIKLRYDDMAGADYYIENVPYVMYFHEGYGFHGVTWHANFGHPMSHGCVNQPNDMAEWLFHFAEVGTLVNVHE
jgi:hypothetical protein